MQVENKSNDRKKLSLIQFDVIQKQKIFLKLLVINAPGNCQPCYCRENFVFFFFFFLFQQLSG